MQIFHFPPHYHYPLTIDLHLSPLGRDAPALSTRSFFARLTATRARTKDPVLITFS